MDMAFPWFVHGLMLCSSLRTWLESDNTCEDLTCIRRVAGVGPLCAGRWKTSFPNSTWVLPSTYQWRLGLVSDSCSEVAFKVMILDICRLAVCCWLQARHGRSQSHKTTTIAAWLAVGHHFMICENGSGRRKPAVALSKTLRFVTDSLTKNLFFIEYSDRLLSLFGQRLW